jgi:serine/threonine protein kinase
LLTGRLPFEGPTTTVLAKTLIQPPKPPTSHREDVDPRLEAICLKALAKKPEERFPTMLEMASALTEFIRAERRNQSGHAQYASTLTDSSDPFPDESAEAPTSFNAGPSRVSPNLMALRQSRLIWKLAAGAGLLGAVLVLVLSGYFLYSFLTKPKAPASNAANLQPRGNIVFSLNKFGDDVELRVDGKLVRASDQQLPLQLTPGEHHVIVAAPKHEVFMKTFVIREGDNPAFVIELQPRKKSDS